MREGRHGRPKDNLTLDAMDAEQAGMSYGKFKAMHPNTAFTNESRLAGKKTANQREVVRAQYVKICPTCGYNAGMLKELRAAGFELYRDGKKVWRGKA